MNLAANFDQKCRICGTEILDITCGIPIFGEFRLELKIHKYLYIQILTDDDLPKTICATCFIKIESIDKFASLASKTEEAFKSWLTKNKLPHKYSNQSVRCNEKSLKTSVKSSTYQNIRNSRHVDYITLEQIINDQIVKNPKIIFRQHEEKNILPKVDLSVISYSDLKMGLLIKDQELLTLILKALKWAENDKKASFDDLLQRLKSTSFRDILTNHNLLNDSDVMQIIKSYIGQDNLNNLNNNNNNNNNCNKVTITPLNSQILEASTETSSSTVTAESGDFKMDEEGVTQMEVGVDPDLFLPYEEEEQFQTKNEESVSIIKIENDKKDTKCSKSEILIDTQINTSKLICTACPKVFVTNTDLQEHVFTVHLINTKRTRKKVEEKPAQIKIKRLAIMQVNIGNRMIRKRRPRNDPAFSKFVCTVCGKRLSTKGNLKVHMDTHKPKGKYTCDKCDRIFKTSLNLMRHEQYHAGEQFACDFCSRVYPTNSTLRAHMITHSDIRPHHCPLCEKTFKRNQDLKFHLNQHSGARPYTCPYCTKSFASSGNCFSHRKRMHSVQVERDKQRELKDLGLI